MEMSQFWGRRLPAGMLLALVAVLLSSSLALAHAHYDHSTPAIGQILSTPPARIDIYTDSEMRKTAGGNAIIVTSADGTRMDDGDTVVDDANRQHFSVGLPPNLPNGRYVVSFQTLSDADGDTDRGRFAFYVGAGPTSEQKQLDAVLNGAPSAAATQRARGSISVATPPPAAVAAGVAVLVIIGAGGLTLFMRKRNARDDGI